MATRRVLNFGFRVVSGFGFGVQGGARTEFVVDFSKVADLVVRQAIPRFALAHHPGVPGYR